MSDLVIGGDNRNDLTCEEIEDQLEEYAAIHVALSKTLNERDAEIEQLRAERALISEQVDLYEMSCNDEMGLDPESTLVAIANILETGHPARADASQEQHES